MHLVVSELTDTSVESSSETVLCTDYERAWKRNAIHLTISPLSHLVARLILSTEVPGVDSQLGR